MLRFSASVIAGVLSQIVTYPLIVVRRVKQVQNIATVTIARQVWSSGGFRGFYKGLVPNIIQIVPSVAIGFTVFDVLKKKIKFLERK